MFFKNGSKNTHSVSNEITEIRQIPSMICDCLGINHPFAYSRKKCVAITESLYPNKNYELAIRTNENVLFYKISWNQVINREINNIRPIISFHPLNDETIHLEINDSAQKLINIAFEHYKTLLKNIRNKEKKSSWIFN
jgi:hypothetical protein